jgi:hypothetical protein
MVVASTDDTNPKNVDVGAGRPITTSSFTVYVHRADSHTTYTNWIAVDRVGTKVALATFADDDEPASVSATFSHADMSCPEAAFDPHELLVPADQTDWLGAVCAECGTVLVAT